MLKPVTLTHSGFTAVVVCAGNDFWVQDASTKDWYFNAFTNGSKFELLIEGEACHRVRIGEPVADRTLLEKLRKIKDLYVERHFC